MISVTGGDRNFAKSIGRAAGETHQLTPKLQLSGGDSELDISLTSPTVLRKLSPSDLPAAIDLLLRHTYLIEAPKMRGQRVMDQSTRPLFSPGALSLRGTSTKLPPGLDSRSAAVLREIVEQYLETGEPIGSRTLSRRLPMALSPATIRNVMADLTELGLLFAPHTSAGRLPTERGLRLFVEGLLQFGELGEEEQEAIGAALAANGRSLEELLTEASNLLAVLSSAAGLVLAPKTEGPHQTCCGGKAGKKVRGLGQQLFQAPPVRGKGGTDRFLFLFTKLAELQKPLNE